MFRRNEPLGLPRGSVRALLTIAIVGAFLVGCFVTLREGSFAALAGAMGVVIRDYFGLRKEQADEEKKLVPGNGVTG